MKYDGGQAFPNDTNSLDRGMTLRDWFAGIQLSGACANPNYQGKITTEMVEYAYKFADLMITEREK